MTEGYADVRLIGFPIPVWRTAQEHHEELRREFALLVLGPELGSDVPRRLVDLVRELNHRFADAVAETDAARDAAAARGDTSVDLTYRLPVVARDAVVTLARLLDEADEFCRDGGRLLTLATPEPALAFRRWYLSEFVAQIDGAAPRPWPGVEAALRIDVEPLRA